MTALKAKTRAAVLQIAEWQLGVVEMPTNSNKVKYNTAYYGREVSGGAYAWCMAFTWWVFREAGFSLYKTARCSAFVQRYRTAAPAITPREAQEALNGFTDDELQDGILWNSPEDVASIILEG